MRQQRTTATSIALLLLGFVFTPALAETSAAPAGADPMRAQIEELRQTTQNLADAVGVPVAAPKPSLPPGAVARIAALEEALAKIGAQERRLREAISSGAIDADVVTASLVNLQAKRMTLTAALEEARRQAISAQTRKSLADRLGTLEGRVSAAEKALAAPPPAAPVAPAPVPPAPSPASARLTFGEAGFLQIQTLAQVWFLAAFDDNFAKASGSQPYVELADKHSTFRLRRAEVKLSGDIGKSIGFLLMLDGAKVPDVDDKTGLTKVNSKLSLLQDLVVTFRHIPYAHVSIGQAKLPISLEGQASSAQLLFAERSELSRAYGDARDLGLWIHYKFPLLAYRAGIYNGNDASLIDNNSRKDLVLRLETYPVAGLTVAGSWHRTLASDSRNFRTTYGGDVRYERWGCLAHAEYYARRIVDGSGARTRSQGVFGMAACRLGRWQPAMRFDWFDPDRDNLNKDYARITAGVNLILGRDGLDKLQLNYLRSEVHGPADDNLVLLAAQSGF